MEASSQFSMEASSLPPFLAVQSSQIPSWMLFHILPGDHPLFTQRQPSPHRRAESLSTRPCSRCWDVAVNKTDTWFALWSLCPIVAEKDKKQMRR